MKPTYSEKKYIRRTAYCIIVTASAVQSQIKFWLRDKDTKHRFSNGDNLHERYRIKAYNPYNFGCGQPFLLMSNN